MKKYLKLIGMIVVLIVFCIGIYSSLYTKLTNKQIINNFIYKKELYFHGTVDINYNDKYERDYYLKKILDENINEAKIFGKFKKGENDEYIVIVNVYSKNKRTKFEEKITINKEILEKIIIDSIYDEKEKFYNFNLCKLIVDNFNNDINIKMKRIDDEIVNTNIAIKGVYMRKLNMDINYDIKIEIEP